MINDVILQRAIALEIEDGKRCRTDTTVVETDIKYPSDSGLLWDCIRVFTRFVDRLAQIDRHLTKVFPNRLKRAKRLARKIHDAASLAPQIKRLRACFGAPAGIYGGDRPFFAPPHFHINNAPGRDRPDLSVEKLTRL